MKKTYKIIIIVLATILVGLTVYLLLRPQGEVRLISAPSTGLAAKINGQSIDISGGSFSYQPGNYNLVLSSSGYYNLIIPVTIAKDNTTPVYAVLLPSSNEAHQEMMNQTNLANIQSNFNKQKQALIKSLLPLKEEDFTANYCPSIKASQDQAVCIDGLLRSGINYFQKYGITQENDNLLLKQPNNLQTIVSNDEYKVDYYQDPDSKDQMITIDVTPNDSEISNQQREIRRQRALDILMQKGYQLDNYHVFYSDPYLIKYNEDIHGGHSHARE